MSCGRRACARPRRTCVPGRAPRRLRCARPVGAGAVACVENTSSKLSVVPEGDALHRAALRLQPLVGQRLEVESPNPRAQATQVAPRVDGRVLESVEAVGKNLLLRFEGGLVVRSHLRMTGRWRIEPRGKQRTGLPWLVLRGETLEGVLWNGPVLTLETRNLRRLGPDVLAEEFDVAAAAGPAARSRDAGSARRSRISGSSRGSGTCGCRRRSGRSPRHRGHASESSRTPFCATPSTRPER